ncbi:MAG: pyridoxal phosphate-dependent aminotransferase [Holophagaceae bacterium]
MVIPAPASRIASLKPSPIRILSEGAPPDAIPLGLGEPTWALPEPARKALAATAGVCAYGPNMGLMELRRAVAAWHGVSWDEVIITSGSSGALFSLFQAFVNPGDQVLLPDPAFPVYEALSVMCGAEARPFPLDAADRFRLDAEAFARVLEASPRAKLAVVNAPSNPTGGGASLEALATVARACEDRGVLLVSDEVYRDLHFGTRPPTLRDVSSSGVVVTSVSKGWGAPGLRVGWAIGDPRVLAQLRIVHGYAVTAAAQPAQKAALALLEASDTVLPAARAEIYGRFVALREALKAELGQDVAPPDGTFYHFMALPEAALPDPWSFCVKLRDEAKVVLVPGQVFGPGGAAHVRLSFAASPEQLREGVRRLAPHWAAKVGSGA